MTVIYGNRAFGLSIEDFQLKSGKNPLQDFSSVQPAMEQCCRELKAVSCELPQWDNSLIELLPVQLQHVDGSLQLALLYKLFSLEFSRSPGFAEDALSSLPYTTWACSMNGEIFWTNRASKQYAYGAPDVTQLGHQEHMAKIHPDDVQQASLSFSTGWQRRKPEEVQETDAPLLFPVTKGSAGSVLLIEDDEAVRQAVSMVRIEHGYRIVAAANPAHAIGLRS